MRGFETVDDKQPEMTPEEVSAYKRDFALALLRNPNDCFKAALEVFSDTVSACKATSLWVFDEEVLKYKQEIVEREGEEAFLPSKAQYLNLVWSRMEKEEDASGFAKLADVYAKARNFYPKESAAQIHNHNNFQPAVVTNKVMTVRLADNETDWRTRALSQQQRLIAEASSS